MSRDSIIFLVLLFAATNGFCQKMYLKGLDTAKPYGVNYHKAEFMGGDDSLDRFINKNMRYPDAARESNISGRVIIRFLVDERGGISNAMVLRRIGGGCDEEAMRMVKLMPNWKPATYKGKPTRSVQVFPVVFKLE